MGASLLRRGLLDAAGGDGEAAHSGLFQRIAILTSPSYLDSTFSSPTATSLDRACSRLGCPLDDLFSAFGLGTLFPNRHQNIFFLALAFFFGFSTSVRGGTAGAGFGVAALVGAGRFHGSLDL
jgi:hypothetical protein